jgi:hypothetical protein
MKERKKQRNKETKKQRNKERKKEINLTVLTCCKRPKPYLRGNVCP